MTSAKSRAEAADEIARLARLFSHPVRIRLMLALADAGTSSATVLSGQLGDVTVGDCHYHLTRLKDGGAVKLVRSRPVRGATERVYRLAPRPHLARGATHLGNLMAVLMPMTTVAANTPEVGAPASQGHGV